MSDRANHTPSHHLEMVLPDLRLCGVVYLLHAQSVYVDQYGEEDPHLRRGRPLFLSRQR